MFIHPDFRGILGASIPSLLRATQQKIQELNQKNPIAVGIVVITENKKLIRPGIKKLFKKEGWQYKGQTKRQQDIWFTLISNRISNYNLYNQKRYILEASF